MPSQPDVMVDAQFPGGNILIDAVHGGHISARHDPRDSVGGWFYWYFRVTRAAGRTVTVDFSGDNLVPIGVRGPAVSFDRGQNWQWLGANSTHKSTFVCHVPEDVDETRFSFGMPYVAADLQTFLEAHSANARLVPEVLTHSEQGRPVELLRIGQSYDAAKFRALITCRHHCCEMMASYVLEGLMDRVLRSNDPIGRWISENVALLVVPLVDKDGVEAGDQGKNRQPHDHNRDYGPDDGIYASVRAIRNILIDPATGQFDIVLDLHCPWISGSFNEKISFVGSRNPETWNSTLILSEQLEYAARSSLPYRTDWNLPFGTEWNTDENLISLDGRGVPKQSMVRFLEDFPHVGVEATLEIPYANVDGEEVNTRTARQFGADLAYAVQRYLLKAR